MPRQKTTPHSFSPRRAVLIGALAILGAWALGASAAQAAGPVWKLTLASSPTNFAPGAEPSGGFKFKNYPQYNIVASNVGTEPTSGEATITDVLPTGVTPAGTYGEIQVRAKNNTIVNKVIPCEIIAQTVTCEEIDAIPPGGYAHVAIAVKVAEAGVAPPSVSDKASIVGGGAGEAVARTTTTIDPGVAPFDFISGSAGLSLAATGANGAPATQAGSHPAQLTIDTGLPVTTTVDGDLTAAGHLRDLHVNLPRGMVVNPEATPVLCTAAQLESTNCPDASAIGTVTVQSVLAFGSAPDISALYNMPPPPGTAANFGFVAVGEIIAHIIGGVNTAGEYELGAGAGDILARELNPILSVQTVLWGNPSDPRHDPLRGRCAVAAAGGICPLPERPDTPLLTMPGSCRPSLIATGLADSWEEPADIRRRDTAVEDPASGEGTPTDGCNALDFKPEISAKPTTNLSDAPTGLDFNLHVPQTKGFDELATANFKDVKVTFPPGIAVNPSSANGLGACTPAQFGLTSGVNHLPVRTDANPANCPDNAKIGSVEVSTPLVDHPVLGALYTAQPYENPFGTLLAVYLTVDDEQTGVVSKLAGKVEADPVTGQLTTTFADNPELPIEDATLKVFGGPRAALKTPLACGTHQITSEIVPWSTPEGVTEHPSDSFQTSVASSGGGVCPTSEAAAPNDPSFEAGTLAPQAGAYSPFVLKLSRPDGSQQLTGIDATLPKGLLAKLAGTSYCSEAQIAAAKAREVPRMGALEQQSPSCPLSSEVGTVTVGAGAGITPFYATGKAYLAGPYKGAPLSLVVITPAVAGPYDLGSVVVRNALYVNPETAEVHAVSDPLPSIREGIPLDLRSVVLKLDRPNFTLNPTSCDPMAITGFASTLAGQSAALRSPFQVGGCSALGFKPKLAITLKGATKRTGHPAVKAVVTYPQGNYANIAKAQVTLPHSAFLDTTHIKTICTRVQFAANACPKGAIYGFAKATTPLLDKPLEGPVYLRSSSHKLPDLVMALSGQIDAVAVARVDTGKGNGIRTTFEGVPDAPLSKVVLEMKGGKKGLLINSEDICSKTQKAIADFTAQNGKVLKTTPLIANGCGGKAKHKAKKHGKAKGQRKASR